MYITVYIMPRSFKSTPFMDDLSAKMTEYGLADTSRVCYLRNLELLNDEKSIDNLHYLFDFAEVEKKLTKYSKNTQRVYYTSIHSALKLIYTIPDDGMLERIDSYHERMMRVAREHKLVQGKKTQKQEDNWVTWDEIIDKWDEMYITFKQIQTQGGVKHSYEYTFLLHFVILTLYVKMLPRRNQDYLEMVISQKRPDPLDDAQNYLILDENKFVFQKFKTFKSFGVQESEIPEDVMEIFWFYINSRKTDGELPTMGIDLKKGKTFPFLLFVSGRPFDVGNSITRCLNRVFAPRKVGCAMLRTIFATDNLLEAQEKNKKIADGMAHSVSTQQNIYIKH
jgi:hypothetical protein